MLARDIMTRRVVAVTPLTPVKQVAKILNKNHISGAPVMSKSVIRVKEDTPVEDIASLMATRKVKRVPVIRGQHLAGIVSRADIIRAIALGEHIAMLTPVYDL